MIPIVRRHVKITTTAVLGFPFRCWSCHLATTAHVKAEGVGTSTTAYISPNQDAATKEAQAAMHANARKAFDFCLCPRCGAPSQVTLQAIEAWDRAYPGGRRVRKTAILLVGTGITVALALACVVTMMLTPTEGMSAMDMLLGPAVCGVGIIVLLGGLATLIPYMASISPPRPILATRNPTTVWFDPPTP